MNRWTRRGFIGGIGACGGLRLLHAAPGTCLGDTPNLRFGVLSDLHIQCVTGDRGYGGGPEIFEHALAYYRDRKVDAVMIAGDMSDLGLGDELVLVGKTWDKVFPDNRAPDGRIVEKIFITGNHESGTFVNPRNLKHIRSLYNGDDAEVRRQLLRTNFAFWWEKAFHEPYERFYHKNVKGYDFLNAHWDDGTRLEADMAMDGLTWSFLRERFGHDLKDWLDRNKAKLDPSKPFFYQQHRNLWKTTYADWGWNHDKGLATDVLSAFPNAVTFSGDTHFSLTDDRSVWQGTFTAFGTSSLRYSGTPYDSRDLASFENTEARYRHRAKYDPVKTMKAYDPMKCWQGMVVNVYDDRMVVERRDFFGDQPLGDDWVLPLPVARATKPYAFTTRKEKAKKPAFVADAKLTVRCCKAKNRHGDAVDAVELVIPPAVQTSRDRCIEFAVTAFGKDGVTAEFNVLAEGFDRPPNHPRACGPTVFSVAVDRLPVGTTRFEVAPLDCWWNRGLPLTIALPSGGCV